MKHLIALAALLIVPAAYAGDDHANHPATDETPAAGEQSVIKQKKATEEENAKTEENAESAQ